MNGSSITKHHIERIVAIDKKARFAIKNNAICAVNGHSIKLPEFSIPKYNETARGNTRYLVHKTYLKCSPGILKDGLGHMSRNNKHLSMETGRVGLQRKQKPNVVIYVDVMLAKRHGLDFLHCSNDVIMCPRNKRRFISPYFFHEIRNKNTGELLNFRKRLPPVVEKEQSNETEDELELPPPAGATGFEHTNDMKRNVQNEISGEIISTNRSDAESINFKDSY